MRCTHEQPPSAGYQFQWQLPPHLHHARFDTESNEEEDHGEYFGEEDFEYDSYNNEEPVCLPKMGPGGGCIWDSSDGEGDRGRSAQFDEGEH